MTPKKAPIYQLDAFSDVSFKGNPAAVSLMPTNLDYDLYLTFVKEMNISETAFIEEKSVREFKLRWFTPKHEELAIQAFHIISIF